MIADELTFQILQALGHAPTDDQHHAATVVADFLAERSPNACMVLRGAAGTGKTTLAAAIVRALTTLKQKMILMAPTGRAAKVFSLYADTPASTIHRRIYRQRTAGDMSSFTLGPNLSHNTLFIVDEASMISLETTATDGDAFGSGSLLYDLVRFVYQGDGCRLMLIGDRAQLPPVGADLSPALDGGVLRSLRLDVFEADLSEVLRQSQESGVLFNATMIRRMLNDDVMALPKMHLNGFADIVAIQGDELIESLSGSYSRVGIDDTIVVTRSNKRANIYNQGIRRTILDREDELCRGDQLMIVKNNYSHPPRHVQEGGVDDSSEGPSFLANGDRCVVQRVRHVREMHGFRFADVEAVMPDYDDYELSVTVMLDTLTTEAPALTREQQEQLYKRVMDDYADLRYKADRLKALKSDVYYNALQIKYGYAVTCHKAQGGQWAHVYIDQGYMTDDMLTPDYLHWLYTALTRATDKVFLVNWPKTQSDLGQNAV